MTKLTEIVNSTKSSTGITVIVCVMIVIMTAIIAYTMNYTNDRNNMARNIEAAIAKGIDPLSVKCAYETNPTATCVTYSLTVKK